MKKIPTIFVRDWDNNPKYVTKERNPECAWVFAGEGEATRKFDGTCVRFDGERWWARREAKKDKQPPPNFEHVALDEETGKTIGWEPADQSGFAKWLQAALDYNPPSAWPVGTYELIGPKINGNPEGWSVHDLIKHSMAIHLEDAPRDFDGLAAWLHSQPYEGIVWHHEDGRMAKIKARDFPREAE